MKDFIALPGERRSFASSFGRLRTPLRMTRIDLRADEDGIGDEAGGDAVVQLTLAFNNEQALFPPCPGLLLKLKKRLDFRVLP